MKKNTIVTIVVLAVIVISATIYFSTSKYQTNKNQLNIPAQQESTQLDDKTVAWDTYQNDEYGFEIKYPSDWGMREAATEFSIKSPGGDTTPVLHIKFVDEVYSAILATEQDKFNKWQEQATEKPSGEINDIVMSGNPAKEFLYFSPVGFVEQIIILSKNGQTIRINSFKDSILDPVLATFKLTK
jgi:hypothetical protein